MPRASAFLWTVLVASVAHAQIKGPSTATAPYVLPVAPGVRTYSILTAGEYVNTKPTGGNYILCGIPDGMGAYKLANGHFRLLVNHELQPTSGVVRAHGSKGAFVSAWEISPFAADRFKVFQGADLIQSLNSVTGGAGPMGRFCSGDLAAPSAYYNALTGKGTTARIYMDHEETNAEGRAFGHIATGAAAGTSQFLARLGRFAGENQVAHPGTGDTTVVAGTDDTQPGQVYVYVGTKQTTGNDFDKAGLTNGVLYGVKVQGYATEDRTNGIPANTNFSMYAFGDVTSTTGATLESTGTANGVTAFNRPEDCAWDTIRPNRLYVVTTDRNNTGTQVGRSRLWALDFTDVNNPSLGGKITMILNGTEGMQMMDNLCVNKDGDILLQEDPGSIVAPRIWFYNNRTHAFFVLAQHDASRFVSGGANYITNNVECSGIIDASDFLGKGWYIYTTQVHQTTTTEMVEGGQLQALYYLPRGSTLGRRG